MMVKINGRPETLPQKVLTLEELVAGMGLNPERLVIEHNLEIVPREAWPGIRIQGNDNIEIVSFVGGG